MDGLTRVCGDMCGGCGFELRFAATCPGGQDYAFPCDACGQVNLDALPERARCDYFFARAMVGRDVARPVVVTVQEPPANGAKRAA
jgi:hypothetical protein